MARITERVGDIFDSPPNSILIRTPSISYLTLPSLTHDSYRRLQHKGFLGRRRCGRLQEIRTESFGTSLLTQTLTDL